MTAPVPAALRYYANDPSRAGAAALRALGGFRGCLSSDCSAGYRAYHGRHQRRRAHLLRDLHEQREGHPDDPAVATRTRAVRAAYDQAPAAPRRPRWLMGQAGGRALSLRFEERAHALGLAYAGRPEHPCRALARRLLRHHGELFRFVRTPGVSPDNSHAERSPRQLVITRKISGDNRRAGGTRTRMALASSFDAWCKLKLSKDLAHM